MLNRNISRKISDITGRFVKERKFWLDKLSGEIIKSMFPCDHDKTPPMGQTKDKEENPVEMVEFEITGELFTGLMNLSKNSDHRLHIVLITILTILLEKYTGNKDIIIGSPIYKQEIEAEFVNTVLAVRNQIRKNSSFKELLVRVKETMAGAIENQNYPIEKLVEELDLPSAAGFPLFDVVILIENIHDKKYIQHIRHNITFYFSRTGRHLKGKVEYNPLRYEKETIERILSHFMNLSRQIFQNIAIKLSDIDILLEKEKEQVLFAFNSTTLGPPPETTIQQLFETQVEKTPGNIAISHQGQEKTYKELNEKANQLALFLISKGVRVGSIVGIMAQRSPDMLVGILGILKAGGAYLPISSQLPAARKKFILRDSSAGYLLLQQHLAGSNQGLLEIAASGDIFYLDDPNIYAKKNEQGVTGDIPNPAVPVGPGNPAYIIYTSGSTGRPKGVILEHRGVVNYVRWAAKTYVKDKKGIFPFYTSFSFDLTVTSIFTPLITGNALLIYSGDQREFLIKIVMEENRVNIVKLTPSHLKLIRDLEIEPPGALHSFIVGGENLSVQLARDIHRQFRGNIKIYNEYGPTETAVGSMIYRFDPGVDGRESVPIGVPIDNTQIYLLDEDKKPVPTGVSGEIFISGPGLAGGYLNRPELTAEKFIGNPFLPGKKMYATGDLGRRYSRANVDIEFLGRKDEQVKIRGFRVELGEIENKILDFNRTGESTPLPHERLFQPSASREVIRCKKCILPQDFPGNKLDSSGVCHVCREYEEKYRVHLERYFKEPGDFEQLVKELKEKKPSSAQYDCLLLFSGGKDSSYVLFRLVDMGLKVLAFTFDNGYISGAAFENMKRITSLLKVELVVSRAEHMNQVFVESLKSNRNVCHGCWHALNTTAIKLAHDRGINMIISGLSRGQIYDMRLEGLFRAGIFNEKEIEEKLLSFRKSFHSKDNKFFRLLHLDLEEEAVENLQFVDFYRYFHTPVNEIMDYLTGKGWVQPRDTGFCSSNCKINDVGIYMFLKEEGYHFYAAPLSWDIRLGQVSREAALAEMAFPRDRENVENILEEIGYYRASTVKDTVVVDKEDETGNRYLCAYIVPETEISISDYELRDYLSRQLPDYMVPSYFVQVDTIPLTASGKVDRKALSESYGSLLQKGVTYVEPRDEKEKSLANLCREVFKLERIGVTDNFFDLGATSFSIIQLNSKLQDLFQKDIPVLTMFEYPTIASLLDHMNLETPAPGDSREGEEWMASRKEGQSKFKALRNKRMKTEERENG
jgi:amino acid adenylation domain-containing protein